MGLINQFIQFNQAVTKGSYLLKPLLSTKVQYIWLPDHQKSFEELKKELSSSPSLAHFDQKFETRLETDASRKKDLDMFSYRSKRQNGNSSRLVQGISKMSKQGTQW